MKAKLYYLCANSKIMHKHLRLFLLLGGLFAGQLQAQDGVAEANPSSADSDTSLFQKYSAGLEGGLSFPFTDVSEGKSSFVSGLTAGIRPLPALQFLLNLQLGQLKGGEELPGTMWFKNNYYYASLGARFYPLALMQNEEGKIYLGNIYVGTGLAVLKSDATSNPVSQDVGSIAGGYTGASVLVPAEIGLNVPLVRWADRGQAIYLNVNYRHHFGFNDKLDGYEPIVEANEKNDVYSQLTLGLSFQF